MKTESISLQAFDGIPLFGQAWIPDGKEKAVICLVHGLGEHCNRYTHVAEALTGAGYCVMAIDLRGHGRSGGKRGHTPSFEAYMKDIDCLFAEARRHSPNGPFFLYGHSMGGLLALNYVLRCQPELRGVVASAPAIRSPVVAQKAKIFFARVVGAILPTITIPTGLDATYLSHDPQVVQAYRQDPLVHGVSTLGMAKANVKAISWLLAHASELYKPLLIMHGGADCTVYPEGSRELAGLVSGDVTLKIWEGAYHEIHNDPEKADVLAYMITWLDAHWAA